MGDGPSSAPKLLSKPTKTDVPLPEVARLEWGIPDVHQVTQGEAYTVVNAKHWKRMDVYKWSVEHDFYGRHGRRKVTSYILLCRVDDT